MRFNARARHRFPEPVSGAEVRWGSPARKSGAAFPAAPSRVNA